MTSELTQIVNLTKSKNQKMKKLKISVIMKCTKLKLLRKIVIRQ